MKIKNCCAFEPLKIENILCWRVSSVFFVLVSIEQKRIALTEKLIEHVQQARTESDFVQYNVYLMREI